MSEQASRLIIAQRRGGFGDEAANGGARRDREDY